ncbi:MAG TPA: hypothetical protein VMU77_02490 [Acidimicrobiales bacterium]|nr:hypothetical protein [Acidimicrobiales bacterium]
MSQPNYVHVAESDEVRPVQRLPAAHSWVQDRVAELRKPGRAKGRMVGQQGPDQGYALKLAHGFEEELVLESGESAEDAIEGCIGVALARASLYGRAPIKSDIELALTLFGYLGDAPAELIKLRNEWFKGCAHDYWAQLALGELVAESTLRLDPKAVRDRLDNWSELFAG